MSEGQQPHGLESQLHDHPIAMVLTDPGLDDNPLVFVNNAFEKVTLYNREAALGRNCRFLQCEETDPETAAKLADAIRNEREVSVDIVNRKADGSIFMNRLVIAPLRNDSGKVTAFLGIQTEINTEADTTEPTQMLRELQHRVKNHLSMVVALIRMQSQRDVTPESFEALSHRVRSLALLYEELSPAGVVNRNAKSIAVGAYLSRIAHTIGSLDGRASIRINVDCEDISLPVEAGARLGLILTELVTNALEHAFEGRKEGVLRIRFQKQTGQVYRLSVEDDGIGMPEASGWPYDAPTVETQVERAEQSEGELSTRGSKRKSGAGGSIVMAMVDNLDGDLSVTSNRHGTIVAFDFEVSPNAT